VITVDLKKPTHVYAQPGAVTVNEAEAARLLSLGLIEKVKAEAQAEPEKDPKEKKATKKKAG
jgi:hypothetical protein